MSKKDVCEVYSYDEKKVNRIQEELKKEDIASVTQLFKALADENREKITFALSQENELCVCDIANIIGSSIATASHHLRTLYKQGIVKYRKEGKLVFYSLDDEHIKQIMDIALVHKKEVNMHV
ncbi:ArsR/SmtB family transcription factor [Caldibacillus debilis]|nr:metalloregulator ArsR/SmtB family transcription factor [Caldibacillus debilis]